MNSRKPVKTTLDATTQLGATPRVRVAVFALLLVPVLLAQQLSLSERFLCCFVPLMITGTFRTSVIRKERFVTRFYVAFLPIRTQRCNLRGVMFVSAKFAWESPGIATLLIFGPSQWIFGWLFELLIPGLGGPYQIHLVTAKGRELVAWRGFVDSHFRKTLDLLTRLTGAEVRSM